MATKSQLKLRPSDANRWLTCRASPGFIVANADKIPEDDSSVYAEEGTRAHDAAAEALLIGEMPTGLPSDMLEYVEGYVDRIGQYRATLNGELYVEERVPLFFDGSRKGFIDAAIIKPDGSSVIIADLKYGMGVSVQARDNPQLGIYGLSFMKAYAKQYNFTDETLVTLVIYQPRVIGEQAIRLWALTYAALKEYGQDINDTADIIKASPNHQPFVASESACKFCPASPFCAAQAAHLLGELPNEPQDVAEILEVVEDKPTITLDDPDVLDAAALARIVAIASPLTKWLENCKAYAKQQLEAGQAVEGFKLVEGRSNRTWKDTDAAEVFLKKFFKVSDLYKMKLVSFPQAEKLFKERKGTRKDTLEAFQEMFHKPPAGNTMVANSDKRPAISTAAEEFDAIEDDGSDLL